jgi:hypothetical protein
MMAYSRAETHVRGVRDVMARTHEVYTREVGTGVSKAYVAECRRCATGSPLIHSYDALRAWVGKHTLLRCNGCGHAGSSHYSAGSSGAGCKTCGCERFRG